jgi:hypothetical protein
MIPLLNVFTSHVMSHSGSIGSLMAWSLFLLVPLMPPLSSMMSLDLLPEPTNLDAGTISSSDEFLTGDSNLLDPSADPSTTASKTNHSFPHCSTRVKTLPTHLRDYHCFSIIATLHEPHSFREARTDPLW